MLTIKSLMEEREIYRKPNSKLYMDLGIEEEDVDELEILDDNDISEEINGQNFYFKFRYTWTVKYLDGTSKVYHIWGNKRDSARRDLHNIIDYMREMIENIYFEGQIRTEYLK